MQHAAIKEQCVAQQELAAAVGKEKRTYCHEVNDEELRKDIWDKCYQKAYDVARQCNANKHLRGRIVGQCTGQEYLASLPEEEQIEKAMLVGRYYHDVEKEAMRRMILDEGVRLDGRTTEQIRPIWCEVGYLPGPHGLRSLPAVRHSLCRLLPWERNWMRKLSMRLLFREKKDFYCTIISRRSQPERLKLHGE